VDVGVELSTVRLNTVTDETPGGSGTVQYRSDAAVAAVAAASGVSEAAVGRSPYKLLQRVR